MIFLRCFGLNFSHNELEAGREEGEREGWEKVAMAKRGGGQRSEEAGGRMQTWDRETLTDQGVRAGGAPAPLAHPRTAHQHYPVRAWL